MVSFHLSIAAILLLSGFVIQEASGGCRIGTKGGLNNKDSGLELEINGNLRLNNHGIMKKLGSIRGAVAPAASPFGSAPRPANEPNEAVCDLNCAPERYITCSNYPGQQFHGCACKCGPEDGKRCVLHFGGGPTHRCWP